MPLADIVPPERTNGRIDLNPDALADLAHSISTTGQLHRITLRPTPDGYELIAGHRRYLAVQSLGHKTIAATIVDADDQETNKIRLAENALRQQLSPIEESYQLAPLVADNPLGVDGVATALGRSASWILDRLDLLTMPDALQQAIHTRAISIAAAKRLARIDPPTLRDQRIEDAVRHGINAQTAALWLQDAQRGGAYSSQSSDTRTDAPTEEYVSATLALCFVCNDHTPLPETRSARVCDTCYARIAQALSPDTQADTG